MAATVRLTRPVLLGMGPFGERVTDLLRELYPGARVEPSATDLERAFGDQPDALVTALWRTAPGLSSRIDDLVRVSGVPWLPVVVEHPLIIVGPWVAPGQAPCHRCYRRRRAQHDTRWNTTEILHQAYDRDASCGPRGFLPHHARLAAGVAAGYLRQSTEDGVVTGRITVIHLQRPVPGSHRVTSCHDCEHCGTAGALGDLRGALRRSADV